MSSGEFPDQRRRGPRGSRKTAGPVPGLQSVRQELGLSREALGRAANVSGTMIGYLETGRVRASQVVQSRILGAVVRLRRERREREWELARRAEKAGI